MITIEFIPYSKIESLDSHEKIDLIINTVKKDKIVLVQGRLKKEEETELITRTMEEINPKFSGIEPATIIPEVNKGDSFFKYIKERIINALLSDRQAFTLIGPANIVREIKRDPDRLELLLEINQEKVSSPKKNTENKKVKRRNKK